VSQLGQFSFIEMLMNQELLVATAGIGQDEVGVVQDR